MVLIESSKSPQSCQRTGVTGLAAKGVTGIRRIGNHAAVAQDPRGLDDQPVLGMRRVDGKILGHGRVEVEIGSLASWIGS